MDGKSATERCWTEIEVADRLNLSVRTLQGWRLRGEGPHFLKFGRSVRYSSAAIESWVCEQERASTSAISATRACSRHNTPHVHSELGDQK
ncbi:helix-turn-helix domain-containing protein [Alteriqipengyuania flavescens]|nr:helix-turn-helix domain-containing protein [Alteriqipengyuania flavescens]WJY26029.1 helix-turn-helix domain-containing protein [Alteriqipengyuania flavescens]